jgi:ADP-heptose:LPS heptosyltransferase/GT2 family glycosyltransferase
MGSKKKKAASAETAAATKPDRGPPQADAAIERPAAVVPTPALPSPALARSGDPAAPSRIVIQLEPTTPAAKVSNRHDFLIRGRVVSAAPVEEVAIFHDGIRVGQVLFGKADKSASAALPDGTMGVQLGFVFNLPLVQASDLVNTDFTIAARTFAGAIEVAAFVLERFPEDPSRGRIISGPTASNVTSAGLPPATIIHTESARVEADGSLRVAGWAVSRNALLAIQIFLDDERIGSATPGGVRDDVANAHPTYPNARNAGFSLTIKLGERVRAAKRVHAQAITVTGSMHETVQPIEHVGGAPAPPPVRRQARTEPTAAPAAAAPPDPRRAIELYIDEILLGTDGTIQVVGWVVCATGVASVSVLLDDVAVGEADLGHPRPDVGEAFSAIPAARFAGFRLRAKTHAPAAGEHVVSVVVRNGLDDTKTRRETIVARDMPAEKAAAVAATTPDPSKFKFQLDSPPLADGVATQDVTGRLTIEGWVVGREGIEGIEVMLDDVPLGSAHYGQARQDVGTAFPDWVESLRSGFAFHCPQRSLRDGDHVMALHVKGKSGDTLVHSFKFTVAKSADADDSARIRRRIPAGEAELYTDMLRRLDWQPRFRVLLRGHDAGAPEKLARTLVSLETQIYPHWRAELYGHDLASREAVAAIVANGRIDAKQIGFLDLNAPSVDFAADPDLLVCVLFCGDELGCDALAEIAVQSGLHREAELLYADEVRENPASGEREVFFKPGYSPDLLLASNYIGRPWFAVSSLLARAGASPGSLLGLGEYDLLLRCVAETGPGGVRAVPRLLCERIADAGEDAATEMQALVSVAERQGFAATVEPGCLPGIWRLRRRVVTQGKVSIIVPTCAANNYIETCVTTLKARTAYRNFEIVAIDNIPDTMPKEKAWLHQAVDKIVDIPEAFNWSRFNNRAAAVADGEFLLFLNDDIEVIQDDWLDAMLEYAQLPEIGIVGPQLLYPDRMVQHAGMFLAGVGLARHAFRFAAADEPGYFGLARTPRNVMAVTGACMLMRRAHFDALGGFDEAHEVINNDLDFCLRTHDAGLRTVYTPHATLIHHELASRAKMKDVYDLDHFNSRWRMRFAEGDPFYNPGLSKMFDDYRPNDEPAREVFSGHPLFRAEDVRRILVVKVDHIGDFMTALPSIRRLKEHFPKARISVLASGTVRSFAALDPAIDEIIDFNFFHVRSALGQRDLDADELRMLSARLAPYEFDLAIDLRKHLDTRELLRYACAKVTAGFDHAGQFPWLDISLEWEGDRRMQQKRYHVTDDLLHLVDTVATAGRADRIGIRPEAVAALRENAMIPEAVEAFLAGTVVCVHAGAGNEMKQWPIAFFASLIDMLIVRSNVRVLLIGGPDEADVEAELMASIEHGDRMMSMVGKLPLHVLPAVIAGCSLYVGNDSGPKHIAASVGIPTIGVHSGTVDPIEWAPMGQRSVAVARAMTCGPCYLNRLDDCSRGLACMRELEPQAVFRVCEMMLAKVVPAAHRATARRETASTTVATAPVVAKGAKARTVRGARKRVGSRVATARAPMLVAADEHGDD